ncbi:MAG: bifunctional phosphoribosylaminoimidazolecarboxamide formyltransferase/IMP cyclohydrolase [Planctomycetes bacterium]|nr:bifunctional phosphoribosylaminoimidazolecarboxamide formyltransferase/IMP cyclohydrolase [Planctomycetota bacterium]
MDSYKIERALLSVSDKSGLVEFARGLAALGIQLFSTGGTRACLEQAGIPVRDVAAYTGFPEMMDGRIKTLHPKIHGGILCRRDRPEDMAALAEHGISTLDLVVVNLYPFEATIRREGVAWDEAIEQIDIGGPTLIRAAAKNHAFVAVVTSPEQYQRVLDEVTASRSTGELLRRELAGAAFAHTAAYDQAIADFFRRKEGEEPTPATMTLRLRRKEILRYGENPHQLAAVYEDERHPDSGLVGARKLHGKELSYNNLLDLDSAWKIVRSLPAPAAVVIKHNNPCGAACAATLAESMRRALDGDPLSAFGSVLGLNRSVDAATAEVLAEPGRFIEAIVAPGYEPPAIEILTTRPKWKGNVRLIAITPQDRAAGPGWELRQIDGGFLRQESDADDDPDAEWSVVTHRKPTDAEQADFRFAWSVVRHVKSNAIVLAKNRTLLGVGAGQMSRVDSVEIALDKAGAEAKGAALASDAFFPFPDSIQHAAAAGVSAIIQPGGSRNDPDVIAACDQHGIAMIFTGRRHFKH